MARAQVPFQALNAGEVSGDALMRLDLEKMKYSCETMENFIPSVLGPVQLRPGTQYIGGIKDNAACQIIPFVASISAKHVLELTDSVMRVWTDDELVTIPSVSTAFTNGTFGSSLATGWTDASGTGASATVTAGELVLTGGSFETAKVQQALTVSGGDQGVRHFFQVEVTAGPVIFRAGSVSGGDQYVGETALGTGTHVLGFVPVTGTVYVEIEANERLARKVNSIAIRSAGTFTVATPWTSGYLSSLKWAQSADVLFVAASGLRPYQIERRDRYSWSVVEYTTKSGPWRGENLTRISLTPGARRGVTTLTASRRLFRSGHVGALFRLTQARQYVEEILTGPSQSTPSIKVTGIGNDRDFVIQVSGTFTGTILLERSFEDEDNWVKYKTYTTTTSGTNDIKDSVGSPAHSDYDSSDTTPGENNDNRIVYYRFSTKSNAAWTGSATVTISHDGGFQTGLCRVTGYTSATSVDIEVLDAFSTSNPTAVWREGEWSDYRGWPLAVALYEGRLWWAGADQIWGSASDDFSNFNHATVGDSAPISRAVGSGPVEGVNWLLALSRLVIGTSFSELVVRSSSLDEPITPANFGIRSASSRGSSTLPPVAVDGSAIFVQRSGSKVYEFVYDGGAADYRSSEVTRLHPTVLGNGCTGIVVQRHPDTRIWFVREDGTIAILVYEPADNVVGWCRYVLSGVVENLAVLPSAGADDVYAVVNRTISGSTVRYLEKFRPETDAEGGSVNWVMDCAVSVTPSPTGTSVTGLSHLNGQSVVVWSETAAARVDQSSMLTVSGGGITLPASAAAAIVGLPYTGTIKTTKLAYASEAGTAFSQSKRVSHVGLVARNIGVSGVKVGKSASKLYALPSIIQGDEAAATAVQSEYDGGVNLIDGGWSADSRVHIQVKAPYPAKILGLVIVMETHDRAA